MPCLSHILGAGYLARNAAVNRQHNTAGVAPYHSHGFGLGE